MWIALKVNVFGEIIFSILVGKISQVVESYASHRFIYSWNVINGFNPHERVFLLLNELEAFCLCVKVQALKRANDEE